MVSNRILILIWASFFAFLSASWLGSTHIVSNIFHADNIIFAANVFFVVALILFALALHYILPKTLPIIIKVVAILPPLAFFVLFLF